MANNSFDSDTLMLGDDHTTVQNRETIKSRIQLEPEEHTSRVGERMTQRIPGHRESRSRSRRGGGGACADPFTQHMRELRNLAQRQGRGRQAAPNSSNFVGLSRNVAGRAFDINRDLRRLFNSGTSHGEETHKNTINQDIVGVPSFRQNSPSFYNGGPSKRSRVNENEGKPAVELEHNNPVKKAAHLPAQKAAATCIETGISAAVESASVKKSNKKPEHTGWTSSSDEEPVSKPAHQKQHVLPLTSDDLMNRVCPALMPEHLQHLKPRDHNPFEKSVETLFDLLLANKPGQKEGYLADARTFLLEDEACKKWKINEGNIATVMERLSIEADQAIHRGRRFTKHSAPKNNDGYVQQEPTSTAFSQSTPRHDDGSTGCFNNPITDYMGSNPGGGFLLGTQNSTETVLSAGGFVTPVINKRKCPAVPGPQLQGLSPPRNNNDGLLQPASNPFRSAVRDLAATLNHKFEGLSPASVFLSNVQQGQSTSEVQQHCAVDILDQQLPTFSRYQSNRTGIDFSSELVDFDTLIAGTDNVSPVSSRAASAVAHDAILEENRMLKKILKIQTELIAKQTAIQRDQP